jgi:hypothetical protein
MLDWIAEKVSPLLVDASGLGRDFPKVRKAVVDLRENLLRSLKDQA